ncbi:hypothetical protein GCM10008935_08100 [Alkalibacillus silvisoli]|uniref:Uncharacterized protein n=1 Tax=Alkalibacillus silvisoli TaxID=392823 RepID=A0ABP3JLV2_9BACI
MRHIKNRIITCVNFIKFFLNEFNNFNITHDQKAVNCEVARLLNFLLNRVL